MGWSASNILCGNGWEGRGSWGITWVEIMHINSHIGVWVDGAGVSPQGGPMGISYFVYYALRGVAIGLDA